jgi:hypothetical protein
MKTFTANGLHSGNSATTSESLVGDFRAYFTQALRTCVKHGFTMEEAFGMIWEEALEEVWLPETLQGQVYEELIVWAKQWKLAGELEDEGPKARDRVIPAGRG